MTFITVPPEVMNFYVKFVDSGMPRFACWKTADGRELWNEVKDLSIAQLQQATAYEQELADKALTRYFKNGSRRTAKRIAEHLYRVRYYRILYLEEMGMEIEEEHFPIQFRQLGDDPNNPQQPERR